MYHFKPPVRRFWDATIINEDRGERYPYIAFDVSVGPDESVFTILHWESGWGDDFRASELELDC